MTLANNPILTTLGGLLILINIYINHSKKQDIKTIQKDLVSDPSYISFLLLWMCACMCIWMCVYGCVWV